MARTSQKPGTVSVINICEPILALMTERAFDDEMLIRRAQSGDRSAFDALVTRHEVKAYQYAFRLTRNSEEASDVVSDAFIRVYNALGNFKGQSSFATWLYRILTNCF